jgi:hypothetical protein
MELDCCNLLSSPQQRQLSTLKAVRLRLGFLAALV